MSGLSSGQDISTQAGAQAAIDSLKGDSSTVSNLRGQLGASASRLETAISRAKDASIESEAAASRIRDDDVAARAAELVATNIRQNASTALLAQAGKLNNVGKIRELLG